jgi:hypothetical protein
MEGAETTRDLTSALLCISCAACRRYKIDWWLPGVSHPTLWWIHMTGRWSTMPVPAATDLQDKFVLLTIPSEAPGLSMPFPLALLHF